MVVVTIDHDLCTGCAECSTTCPAQILAMTDGKATVVGDDCLGCQSCVLVCPAQAITLTEY